MAYLVNATEHLRPATSEMETKALLYLMNFHDDSENVYYFIVDFFNDITGMSQLSDKMWDVQSKSKKTACAKEIGRELVTLFKNYRSDLDFDYYILFLGGVPDTFRTDDRCEIFNVTNITDSALDSLKLGLREECVKKTYIIENTVNDSELDDFLKKVSFVIDNRTPEDYVQGIIQIKQTAFWDSSVQLSIFKEIREKQSGKKNICNVDGIEIQSCDEALNYNRHIKKSEIKLLVLNRILNRNPIEQGIPISFIPTYNSFLETEKNDIIDDIRLSISRALFNKNNANEFWELFGNIYNTIIDNPNDNLENIYRKLDFDIANACDDFDVLSLKYLVAIIMDGVVR